MSSWIKMIDDSDADEDLNLALNQAKTPHGTVDNVLRVHSLRPSTMIGHMKLYKSVLHDKKNTIPQWFQETISSYVSIINKCKYSYDNHWKNAAFLINDQNKKINKNITQDFSYNDNSNKFALSQYEKEIEEILINKIIDELIQDLSKL